MAFGLKYNLFIRSAKFDDIYRLKLSKEGYAGAEINRNVPASRPLILRQEDNGVVVSTSLQFAIRALVDFEMLEFYTTNTREWLAELYQDNYHKNLVSSLAHHANFDTAILDGLSVVQAVTDGSDWSYIRTDVVYNVKRGDTFTVTFPLTITSGGAPRVGMISTTTGTWVSNYVLATEGNNTITLVATHDIDEAWVVYESNLNPAEWSAGDIKVVQAPKLLWKGYIVPEQYEEEYKPAPLFISFIATDGLKLLQEETFAMTGRQTQLDILRHCLDKIGLSLEYSIAINLHENAMDDDYTPLAQCEELASDYNDKSCYEVIEQILGKYNATITQHEGRWYITRQPDKKSDRLIYTSAGVYSKTLGGADVLEIGQLSDSPDVYPVGSPLMLSLEPARRSYKLTQILNRRASYLTNHDFSSFDGTDFEGWTNNSGTYLLQREHEGKRYLFIPGYAFGKTSVDRSVEINNIPNTAFFFKAKFCPMGYVNEGPGLPPALLYSIKVWILVKFTGSGTWYLSEDGWIDTVEALEFSGLASSPFAPQWHDVTVITTGLPESTGTLEIKLYRWQPDVVFSDMVNIGIAYTDIEVYQEGLENYPNEASQEVIINSSALQKHDDVIVRQADIPSIDNNTLIWSNFLTLPDGTPTALWKRSGDVALRSLLSHFALVLHNNSQQHRMVLTGTLRGQAMSFQSILKHAYNSDREFEIVDGEWDIRGDKFSVKIREYFAYNPPSSPASAFTINSVILPSGYIGGGSSINIQVSLTNGGTTNRVGLSWAVFNDEDVEQSSGSVISSRVGPGETIFQVISGIAIPSTADTYYISVWLSGFDAAAVNSSDIVIGTSGAVVACNSIAAVADGDCDTEILVTANFTNSGTAGWAEVEWQLKDSLSNVIASGSQQVYFNAGTENVELWGIYYPSSAGDYTLEIKTASDASWEVSNEFEAIIVS